MKVINGKIAECTEDELYDYYISRDIDDCGIGFYQFMQACKRNDTKIMEEGINDN